MLSPLNKPASHDSLPLTARDTNVAAARLSTFASSQLAAADLNTLGSASGCFPCDHFQISGCKEGKADTEEKTFKGIFHSKIKVLSV